MFTFHGGSVLLSVGDGEAGMQGLRSTTEEKRVVVLRCKEVGNELEEAFSGKKKPVRYRTGCVMLQAIR